MLRRIGIWGLAAWFTVMAARPVVASEEVPVRFGAEVMAVISKAGCNAGTCHGNANGKGGFRLSLRGEDPEADHQMLTREGGARRLDLVEPEESLMLLKATASVPHEGGRRFRKDSWEYRTLVRWVQAGAASDGAGGAGLAGLEVDPKEAWLYAPDRTVQIRARARFTDGSERDVTGMAVYEASGSALAVSAEGRVEGPESGEGVVLVRYLDRQLPVRVVFVPERPERAWSGPKARNEIDRQVFAKLRKLRMGASPGCSDTDFLRRAHLDLAGRLPEAEEARAFVADRSAAKRDRLVERLLGGAEFAEYWGLKWADLLRAEERLLDRKGLELFQRWLRESIRTNKPMDRFVAELLNGRGSTYQNPPANFHRAIREPRARAEAVAQVFLGTRLNCAQCHNHPFDRWTQADYYDWTGLFARVNYKVLENYRRDDNDSHEFKGEQVVYVAESGSVKNPRTEREAVPRLLGEREAAEGDPLERLAAWVVSPENPWFARAQVNRVWYHLMGRGLVEPIDDFRATNPASHPELLDELAAGFVRDGYDLKKLIRRIMGSAVYQLSSEPTELNGEDEMNYARASVRRLPAEVLLDCQSQVTGTPLDFSGFPRGVRAVQLPGALPEGRRDRRRTEWDDFLAAFGKPPRLLTCECERSTDTTMGQAFQMISGPAVNQLLTYGENRLGRLASSGLPERALVEELYWAALSRPPSVGELERAAALMRRAGDRRAGLEDLAWALMNAKEFVLRK